MTRTVPAPLLERVFPAPNVRQLAPNVRQLAPNVRQLAVTTFSTA